MWAIILWLFSTIANAFWLWFRKKALDSNTLPNTLFMLYAPVFWLIVVLFLLLVFWFNINIFNDYIYLLVIFIILIFNNLTFFLEMSVYKNTKLSELLPYDNIDKIFIIIIWFFLFYGTDKWVSITTLLISILTIIVITLFSIDFKNIKSSKYINYYIICKIIYATSAIWVWYILIKYSSQTYTVIQILFSLTFLTITWVIFKNSFNTMLTQPKQFYLYRWLWAIWYRISVVIWFYIIETSWIIIATLLGFIAIVFNIFSMKLIVHDNPTKKQILLAIIVIVLIWTWYYFK